MVVCASQATAHLPVGFDAGFIADACMKVRDLGIFSSSSSLKLYLTLFDLRR
jgi:hypothetical protein